MSPWKSATTHFPPTNTLVRSGMQCVPEEPHLVSLRAFLKQHGIGFKSNLTTRVEIKKLAKVAYFQLNIAYESSEAINRTLKNVTRK